RAAAGRRDRLAAWRTPWRGRLQCSWLCLCSSYRLRATALSVDVRGEVEGGDTIRRIRPFQNFRVGEGVKGIRVAGLPVLLHGRPRELVVLRRALVALGPVDEVDDVVDL